MSARNRPLGELGASYYRDRLAELRARVTAAGELDEPAARRTAYAGLLGGLEALADGAIQALNRAEARERAAAAELDARETDEALADGRCPICGRPLYPADGGASLACFDPWPAVVFHAACVERIGGDAARELARRADPGEASAWWHGAAWPADRARAVAADDPSCQARWDRLLGEGRN